MISYYEKGYMCLSSVGSLKIKKSAMHPGEAAVPVLFRQMSLILAIAVISDTLPFWK